VPFLEALVADERRGRFKGDTDSERLFHALLTRFERDGVSPADPDPFRQSFVSFFKDLRARHGLGSFNVVLSDGKTLWAHRFGRTLAVLRREEGAGGTSVLVASERLTDEAWVEVPDGTVLEVAGGGEPTLRVLDGDFVF
jgi:glutamine amidotransferase